MASSSSHKKRLNQRSNSKPNPNPKPVSSSPMASGPTPPNSRKISLIFFVFLIFFVVLSLGISSSLWTNLNSASVTPSIYSIDVVNEFPHDPQAFTQGLVYAENDTLFESTGLNGRSSVRKVALQTGKVEAIERMDNSYFGEGLTLIDKRLFQVTWMTKTGFIYDRNNLSKVEFLEIKVFLGTFVVDLKELVLTFEHFCLSIMLRMRGCRLSLVFKKFAHQMKDGWGLATDGKVMFGSDGTSTLYKIDPQTMKVIDKQLVKFKGKEVHNLNELEFINGEVWANVWETDCIARISHEDGGVLGWILLPSLREGLIRKGYHGIDVLNGIAWDNDKNRIFVTGKLWPRLYEIKLHPFQKQPSRGSIERLCLRAPHDFSRP